MKTEISEYQKQAIDFLNSTNTEFKAEFLRNGVYFPDDKESRDIYQITLKRADRVYSFEFGQSISKSLKFKDKLNKREFTGSGHSAGSHSYSYLRPDKFPKNKAEERFSDFLRIEGEKPTEYDVLACLTKYDPGTFKNFCSEFGYDTDSRKAKKTFKAVRKEYQNLKGLFSDSELELMQEIN